MYNIKQFTFCIIGYTLTLHMKTDETQAHISPQIHISPIDDLLKWPMPYTVQLIAIRSNGSQSGPGDVGKPSPACISKPQPGRPNPIFDTHQARYLTHNMSQLTAFGIMLN